MNSYLHAYDAYEKRLLRGEFTPCRRNRRKPFPLLMVLEAVLGDLMISAGRRLKSHAVMDYNLVLTRSGSKA